VGFEEGHEEVESRNRMAWVFIFIRGSQTRLRQSDYELRVRDGFGH
jgi:hypothetical protein